MKNENLNHCRICLSNKLTCSYIDETWDGGTTVYDANVGSCYSYDDTFAKLVSLT